MAELEAVLFDTASGECVEYKADGHTLAYMDYTEKGAEVTVFRPHNSTSRSYSDRGLEAAHGIVERHLKALGYDKAAADADMRRLW